MIYLKQAQRQETDYNSRAKCEFPDRTEYVELNDRQASADRLFDTPHS